MLRDGSTVTDATSLMSAYTVSIPSGSPRILTREAIRRFFMLKFLSPFLLIHALFALAFVVVAFGAQSGSSSVQSGTIRPDRKTQSLPDLRLSSVPGKSLSVKFLVLHRSALNGRTVSIRGVIVAASFGDNGCSPRRGICMQPSLFLSDHKVPTKAMVIRVLLPVHAQEKDYPLNSTVTMEGKALGDASGVVLDSSR